MVSNYTVIASFVTGSKHLRLLKMSCWKVFIECLKDAH